MAQQVQRPTRVRRAAAIAFTYRKREAETWRLVQLMK